VKKKGDYRRVVRALRHKDEKIQAQRAYCAREGVPAFAHAKCVECGKSWTDHHSYTLEVAGKSHIMACPWCGWSWCD